VFRIVDIEKEMEIDEAFARPRPTDEKCSQLILAHGRRICILLITED
jgi:hypothetical protein